jgi:hypothetical protein
MGDATDRLELKLARVRSYVKVVNGKAVRVGQYENTRQGRRVQPPAFQGGPTTNTPPSPNRKPPGKAPLGAKVVKDLRSILREDMSRDQVQAVIDQMRETYRSTGDFEIPRRARRAMRDEKKAARVKTALKSEFARREKKRSRGRANSNREQLNR